jgi:Tfp pilus assembly protein PilV
MRDKGGFTILELIGSISVFVVGLSALLAVVTASLTMGRRGDYAYIAYNLAKNHAESLRAFSYSDLSDAGETDTIIDETGMPDAAGAYIRNTTITTNYLGDANATQATVSVRYNFRGVESPDSTIATVYYNG